MWADDRLWLPAMLAGRSFDGRFVFDGDALLEHHLDLGDPARALFERLARLGIPSETIEHPPVFTVEQARRLRGPVDGAHVKNLFLRNKRGEHWLVTALADRTLDLKALSRRLGAGNLTFASPARLRRHLGVEPGSVTPLAALHDTAGAVRVCIDRSILQAVRVHCHPLTNDRTTALAPADLLRFLADTGHPAELIDLDA